MIRTLLALRRDGRVTAARRDPRPFPRPSLRLWDAGDPTLRGRPRRAALRCPARAARPSHADCHPAPRPSRNLAQVRLDLADHLGIGSFAYAGGLALGGRGRHCSPSTAPNASVPRDRMSSAASETRRMAPAGRDRARRGEPARLADGRRRPLVRPAFAAGGAPDRRELIDDLLRAGPIGYAASATTSPIRHAGETSGPSQPPPDRRGPRTTGRPPSPSRELAEASPARTCSKSRRLPPRLAEHPRSFAEALLSHLADAEAGTRPERIRATPPECAAGPSSANAHVGPGARTQPHSPPNSRTITRTPGGEIWTRRDMERRMRSAVTLTALVAQGHPTSSRCTCARRRQRHEPRRDQGDPALQTRRLRRRPGPTRAFAWPPARTLSGTRRTSVDESALDQPCETEGAAVRPASES